MRSSLIEPGKIIVYALSSSLPHFFHRTQPPQLRTSLSPPMFFGRFVFQHRWRHTNSLYICPRSKHYKKGYLLWEEAITTVLQFKQLGDWFHRQHSFSMYKYDTVYDLVYVSHTTQGWDVYTLDGKPHNRKYPIYNHAHLSTSSPSPYQRGTL